MNVVKDLQMLCTAGTWFERGGQSQVSHFRRLIQLNYPKEKNPKLSFTFVFYLNEIFLGPDITSRDSGQWFLASLGYPQRFLVLLIVFECHSTSCVAQCIMHRWVTRRQFFHAPIPLICLNWYIKWLFPLLFHVKVALDHPSLLLNLALLVHKEMWEDTGSLKWSWCLGHFP